MLQPSYCKSCDPPYNNHTSLRCPRKLRAGFSAPSKPMKHESDKARQKRRETAAAWDKANPPDENGQWLCYISKHPFCPKLLTRETLVREHDKSKARSPGDKHNIKNIYPACTWDNEAKGSLSAAEYLGKDLTK